MRYFLVNFCSLFFTYYFSIAQGVGIGTDSPDPSALLHVKEKSFKGVLIPRLTIDQINSINADSQGLFVYNKTDGIFMISNGAEWLSIEPLPRGSIIMWNGKINDIPSGWVLCDGRSYDLDGTEKSNGISTPDLKNKFIVSYDSDNPSYDEPGESGGSDFIKLNRSQLPGHTHIINSNHSHEISISGSSHNHAFEVPMINIDPMGGYIGGPTATYTSYIFQGSLTSESTDVVVNEIEVDPSETNMKIKSTGGDKPHENRPPYYVLAFIMKL